MFRIFTTLYNAENYINACLTSIEQQTRKDWVCYITDDLSTDRSAVFAQSFVDIDPERFVLIKNTKKMYQPGNYYQCVHRPEINDDDIIITLDGDDWFSDTQVLERLASYYSDGNTWATFGQFAMYNGPGQPLVRGWTQRPTEDWSEIRNVGWHSTHLRTCKAFLMKRIKEEHLIAPSGNYWEMTGDQAIYFPVLEMAGKDRVKYTNDINMVYNAANPLNDHKVDVNMQRSYEQLIRKTIPKYKLIKKV